jgi:hypothetical protein
MTSACRCAIRYIGAQAPRDNVDRYVQARDDDETRIGLGNAAGLAPIRFRGSGPNRSC